MGSIFIRSNYAIEIYVFNLQIYPIFQVTYGINQELNRLVASERLS